LAHLLGERLPVDDGCRHGRGCSKSGPPDPRRAPRKTAGRREEGDRGYSLAEDAPMPTPLPELRAKVHAQKTRIPRMYGGIDFDHVPERFTADPAVKSMFAPSIARKPRS